MAKRMGEHLTALFDLLMSEQRVTNLRMSEALRLSHSHTEKVIRAFRLVFGNDDTINLVAESTGQREPWHYYLAGRPSDDGGWSAFRVGYQEASLETVQAVIASFVKGLSGRGLEAQKARYAIRSIGRVREDLADLREVLSE